MDPGGPKGLLAHYISRPLKSLFHLHGPAIQAKHCEKKYNADSQNCEKGSTTYKYIIPGPAQNYSSTPTKWLWICVIWNWAWLWRCWAHSWDRPFLKPFQSWYTDNGGKYELPAPRTTCCKAKPIGMKNILIKIRRSFHCIETFQKLLNN